MADVLLNLLTGERKEKGKYMLIQEKFSELFPNLELDVKKNRKSRLPEIEITKKSTNHTTLLNDVGSGVIEIVIFLANLITAENKIFCIEEPETHLHPHAQRLMFEFIQECNKNNQILVISHSPFFVNEKKIESHKIVKEVGGKTQVNQLPKKYIDRKENSKIEQIMDTETKEIFFSRKVLLTEGPTEKGALPIFAKNSDNDFDKSGISIIYVGGKNNFEMFVKILQGFKIPYSILCDRDAIMDIGRGKINGCETSSLFVQLNNLGILKGKDKYIKQIEEQITEVQTGKKTKKQYNDKLFDELADCVRKYNCYVLSGVFEDLFKELGHEKLIKEAKREVGKNSKPRQGVYIAKRIIELEGKVPSRFTDLINDLVT